MYNEKPIFMKWAADMYDQKVTETDDVEFLLSIIGATPRRILEICCGSGRILVPLAKVGHSVCGLDADPFMLAKIPTKAEGLANIEWREADAVQGNWGGGNDVVVLAANILNNIVSDMGYEQSQKLFIEKAASALAPGGYLYIDYCPSGHRLTVPDESHEHSDESVIWAGEDGEGNYGRMILIGGGYDAATQMDSFIRRFELTLKNGEAVSQEFPCQKHYVSLDQLHDWLQEAGFTIEQEYADYHRNPIDDNSIRVIIYARKG